MSFAMLFLLYLPMSAFVWSNVTNQMRHLFYITTDSHYRNIQSIRHYTGCSERILLN